MVIPLSAGRHESNQFVIAVARDITERKRMEDALRKSEQKQVPECLEPAISKLSQSPKRVTANLQTGL